MREALALAQPSGFIRLFVDEGRPLAQLLAEGKGPGQLRSFVQINETALLENPLAAMRAGLRRASGGILVVPNIERFFADRLRAVFPEQVNRELHKALLTPLN